MLLRPILLHVVRYSEYISDRDTEPSGFVSKCAFSLLVDEQKVLNPSSSLCFPSGK